MGYQTKAIIVNIGCNDDGSAATETYLALSDSILNASTLFVSLTGLANDSVHRVSGTVQLQPTEEILFLYCASASGGFDIPYFRYLGIITK